MKQILTILALVVSQMCASQIVVIQINAKWNAKNTMEELEDLDGCEYVFGWLEDQPYEIKTNIVAVPVVVVYKDNVPKMQYLADISLKLNATKEEIQGFVDALKEED